MKSICKGFTLIELLIVVAIIAILAAIAVPNFLEAQVRAKVSRCKADMRSIATAVEAYAVDYNNYPYPELTMHPEPHQQYGWGFMSHLLSTPIAYMTALPSDVFSRSYKIPGSSPPGSRDNTTYTKAPADWMDYRMAVTKAWTEDATWFPGSPDPQAIQEEWNKQMNLFCLTGGVNENYHNDQTATPSISWLMVGIGPDGYEDVIPAYIFYAEGADQVGDGVYDATNGTKSYGDIVRTAGGNFTD